MFSERLRALRMEKHISQTELAEYLKISNRTISMYEQGNSEPNADVIIRLAKFFNVTTDYLLGLSDVKSNNLELSYMSKYLGLSERSINELHQYQLIAQNGNHHVKQKIETLNLFFSGSCELLEHITDYLRFSATHFKDFYDTSDNALTPISSLELWDDINKTSYSDDWDMWSKALLLIIEEELTYLRNSYLNNRTPSENNEAPTER